MLEVAVLVLALTAICIIAFIIILAIRSFTKLRQKGYNVLAILFATICISLGVFVCYNIFEAFNPNDDFYKENFNEEFGVNFPKNGKIIYKDASFPDQHGSFVAVCSFEVGEQDFSHSLEVFPENSIFCEISSKEIDYVMAHYNKKEIRHVYKKINGNSTSYLVFLSDKKKIIYFDFVSIVTGC